ncbi:hypothetical protein [Arthrobacter sp. ok362]|uniref:hypothetical protein n=1 Tax=Arthrobacter sp. ok362 TaxID=1761745 RepID=UPI000880127F|nr:hypothetical protein [Arthrobacter sp. ok362]SDL16098.1 hypothetical protein SAMN04487913_106199 [Arthrobacter sp. ok362]
MRISDRSFSIKKLEPLYMPAGRIGVTNAVDSMVQYSVYRDESDAQGWREAIIAHPTDSRGGPAGER